MRNRVNLFLMRWLRDAPAFASLNRIEIGPTLYILSDKPPELRVVYPNRWQSKALHYAPESAHEFSRVHILPLLT